MERDFFPFVEEGTIPGRPANGGASAESTPHGTERGNSSADGAAHEDATAAAGGCIDACYPARIAVYDDPAVTPRVVVIEPTNVRDFLAEITETVTRLSHEQGGKIPFTIIREIVENYIHASFIEPTITILDGGDTIRFCDQGPGIRDKVRALEFGTTSATEDMKHYIRGVGSGLPIAQQYMVDKGGSLTIEDNISGGTIVTISTHGADETDAIVAAGGVAERDDQQTAASWDGGQAAGTWPETTTAGTWPGAGAVGQGAAQQGWQAQVWGGPGGMPATGSAQMPWGYAPQPAYPGWYPGQPYQTTPQQPYPDAAGTPWQPTPQQAQAPGAIWQVHAAAPGTPDMSGTEAAATAGGTGADSASMAGGMTSGAAGAAGYPSVGSIRISDRGRQALAYLTTHESVGGTDLVAAFGGSAPTWSRELKALDEAGLTHKEGQKRRLTALGGAWLGSVGAL